jgi:hypothetical protein
VTSEAVSLTSFASPLLKLGSALNCHNKFDGLLHMLAFSLRWRGRREPGQLWSISLVESLKLKPRPLSERRFSLNRLESTTNRWDQFVLKIIHIIHIVPIFKCVYSRHILSWIYFKFTNHFNFICYPIYFDSTRRFSLCRNKQTFTDFRPGIIL